MAHRTNENIDGSTDTQADRHVDKNRGREQKLGVGEMKSGRAGESEGERGRARARESEKREGEMGGRAHARAREREGESERESERRKREKREKTMRSCTVGEKSHAWQREDVEHARACTGQ
eukprot:2661683-Pleurochrysis_carterae.AAC.1